MKSYRKPNRKHNNKPNHKSFRKAVQKSFPEKPSLRKLSLPKSLKKTLRKTQAGLPSWSKTALCPACQGEHLSRIFCSICNTQGIIRRNHENCHIL